jgi:hypothetical protein
LDLFKTADLAIGFPHLVQAANFHSDPAIDQEIRGYLSVRFVVALAESA